MLLYFISFQTVIKPKIIYQNILLYIHLTINSQNVVMRKEFVNLINKSWFLVKEFKKIKKQKRSLN
jgi:hypothetical protein